MGPLLRKALFPLEGLVYGPAYAGLQHLIRSPEPIEPGFAWKLITCEKPPVYSDVCEHWPLRPLRCPLLHAKIKQDHAIGIAEHYDVSNDFYELFLDKKYIFYTCADFPPGCQSLEDAQQNKADFILDLINPQPGDTILELGCGWGAMLKRIQEHTGEKNATAN